jgi:hypothetical protein
MNCCWLLTPDLPAKVVICGSGNAGHALLALLGCVNPFWDVRLWKTSNVKKIHRGAFSSVEAVFRGRGLIMKGSVARVSMDPAKVLPGCDFLIITVPACHHDRVFAAAKPFLKRGMVIGVLVAEGGVEWCAQASLGPELFSSITFFSLESTPWVCRILEYGKRVEICGAKEVIHFAVSPPEHSELVGDFLRRTIAICDHVHAFDRRFPDFLPTTGNNRGGFFFLTLQNPNALLHIAIMYGMWHNYDGATFQQAPLFYEGITKLGAELCLKVSNEVQLLGKSLESQLGVDLSHLRDVEALLRDYYGPFMGKQHDLVSMLTTSAVYRGITHPMKVVDEDGGKLIPDFHSRYLTEDLPCGLIVIKGLAELAAVKTPTIDSLIMWAQNKICKQYIDSSCLLAMDSLTEPSKAPQRYGIKSIQDLKPLVKGEKGPISKL